MKNIKVCWTDSRERERERERERARERDFMILKHIPLWYAFVLHDGGTPLVL